MFLKEQLNVSLNVLLSHYQENTPKFVRVDNTEHLFESNKNKEMVYWFDISLCICLEVVVFYSNTCSNRLVLTAACHLLAFPY